MNTFPRRMILMTGLVSTASVLSACSVEHVPPAPASSGPTATGADPTAADPAAATAEATTAAAAPLPTVPGFEVGVFPAVPLFELPDLSLLDASLSPFTTSISTRVPARPGLEIHPAGCGQALERTSGSRSMLLYGDGSGTLTGEDGEITNYGDGSGSFTLNGVEVEVYGDGSGSYDSGDVSIRNYGDGSGRVSAGGVSIDVYGDGSASRTGGGIEHHNYGDGSGSYEDADAGISIVNYGDGAGSYTDAAAGLEITNYGDGTGRVNGTDIEIAPIAPIPAVGTFPPLGVLAPMESCGTTITLQDGVLFDFGEDVIRADAAAVLDELAGALRDLSVPAAEIGGHTDAIGTDEFNQDLSERRAASVVAALRERSVTAELTSVGYGESLPVAPNEIGGTDNPAGRQLNRRVEILIPAF
ncbi:OmpA family protein [Brachybacterium hainanense]|uniref:OmpA family protein n=1 Tax=Brachybacterium hainanense TaxID=1541174 RepID=A0ABV6RAJ9_9MICO